MPIEIEARYDAVRENPVHPRLHEEAITEVYQAVLSPGDHAIDGGAHSGKHSVPLAEAVGPMGKVLAVEPWPKPYAQLCEALEDEGHHHVQTVNQALSDTVATNVSFLVFPDRPGVSGFHRRTDAAGQLEAHEIHVPTTTIDVEAAGWNRVGFVKLDVEGAELLAINGGRRVIEANWPVIHVEGSYTSWDPFGYGPNELLEIAAWGDYQIIDIVGTPMTDFASIDQSFRTRGVWDYLLLPPGERGDVARSTVLAHARANYSL